MVTGEAKRPEKVSWEDLKKGFWGWEGGGG